MNNGETNVSFVGRWETDDDDLSHFAMKTFLGIRVTFSAARGHRRCL